MLLSELGNMQTNDSCALLRGHAIWNQEVENISQVQLLAAYQKLKLNYGSEKAATVLKEASIEAIGEFLNGNIKVCSIIDFDPYEKRLTSNEIESIINSFDVYSKRAILFALYSNMNLVEVVELKHGEFEKRRDVINESYSEGVDYILKTQPRHIFSKYVFWRVNYADVPVPLTTLPQEIKSASKLSWSKFSNQVKNHSFSDFIS